MTGAEKEPNVGVLIFKGMKPGFRKGDLRICADGKIEKSVLSTSYSVIPLWLSIARENVSLAKKAYDGIANHWSDNPENRSSLLIAELTPAIQTYVACGIAFDAFYEQLKPFAKLSEIDLAAWKKNRTKRSAQITEVVRRAYNLNGIPLKNIKNIIEEITKFRDYAVHPSHQLQPASTRPDISVGLDWRFCAYRYETALACYDNTIKVFSYFREKTSPQKEVNESTRYIFDALYEMELVSIPP